MNSELPQPDPVSADTGEARSLHKVILRLVTHEPERRALEAGEVDAIIDPASGSAFLLPAAQRWMLERDAPQRLVGPALDALATQVGVLGASGIVVFANKAWRASAAADTGIGAGLAEGASYLAACDRAIGEERVDASAIAAGIRQVIAGERELFCYEYAVGAPAARRWVGLRALAVAGASAARAVVTREDITARRRTQQLQELECAVAARLSVAQSTSTGLQAVIRFVCESQDWDCGRYFRLDAARRVLCQQDDWGIDEPGVQQFLEKSRGLVLRVGAGLKGRVCQSGQPLWLPGAPQASAVSGSALAPATGDEGAFVFPVTCGAETVGVLAFSNDTVQPPDDRMLQAVETIGAQLGAFLRRQQVLDDLRNSETRFRRLTELSVDWYWEQDRDFRFTRLVGHGLPGAGEVQGKTWWELPSIALSKEQWMEHRAQLVAQWSFCDFEFAAKDTQGALRHYCISGEPVYDGDGRFTGYCGSGRDITRDKREQRELCATEQSAKDEPGTVDA